MPETRKFNLETRRYEPPVTLPVYYEHETARIIDGDGAWLINCVNHEREDEDTGVVGEFIANCINSYSKLSDTETLDRAGRVARVHRGYLDTLPWKFVGDNNLCPVTHKQCRDECCPPGAECNLNTDGTETEV